MATQFGFLSKLEFLQDWVSSLISGINPAIVHNLEKYHTLRKVHYLSAIENVEGDYLEFGVFTGKFKIPIFLVLIHFQVLVPLQRMTNILSIRTRILKLVCNRLIDALGVWRGV
jgi:hypothetical protein